MGRGFNRQVNVTVIHGTFQAIFRYETFLLETAPHATEQTALASLVTALQERGYTQLRSRLQFRGTAYLGNQETWAEHQDAPTTGFAMKLFHTLRTLFRHPRRVS